MEDRLTVGRVSKDVQVGDDHGAGVFVSSGALGPLSS